MNGADVTSASAATAGSPVTISLPSALAIAPGNTAVIVFTAQVGASVTAGAYCNAFTTAYGTGTSQTAGVACLTVASASIGDTVYRDWNGNGIQDSDDEGIPGVVITLSNGLTTTTNAAGQYLFNGLLAGSYVLTVGVPSGYTVTADPVGGLDGQATYVLTSSQTLLTADFGLRPGGSSFIGNQVFEDLANNRVQDPTDPGIANITVRLYEDTSGNGVIDSGDVNIVTTTTSAGGYYTFTGLAAGLNYIAAVDDADSDLSVYFSPESYVASTASQVAVPSLSVAGYLAADFGFWAVVPASIGDTVCIDANSDDLCTTGETGVAGIRVTLNEDSDADGSGDVLLNSATTGITGTYLFADLGPGNYVVSVDPEDAAIPAGHALNVGSITATLIAGQNLATIDFPVTPLITKQVSHSTLNYSDTLVHTLTQSYGGDAAVSGLKIDDPLPAGTAFITASAGATFGSYVSIAHVPGIDDQGSFSTGITVTVAPTVTAQGGTVTVTLRMTATTSITNVVPTLTPVGGNAACSVPAPAGPLTVTNASPQTVVFTCTVSNLSSYTFLGNASGYESGAEYQFATGTSNSVLVSKAGSASVATWNLGSTVNGIDGIALGSGTQSNVYAFAGNGTTEFMSYTPLSNTWAQDPPTDQATNVKQGGSLVWDGETGVSADVYGLIGNNTTTFRSYNLSADAWTNRANLPAAAKFGAALTRVGGVIYALRGNNTLNFYTYTISSNTWATAASMPAGAANVNQGGALATDGTYVYALKGNSTAEFYQYSPVTNTWLSRASAPATIAKGGALVYLNGYFYATRGNSSAAFYRYDPVANAWSDGAVTHLPGTVSGGAALATDGTYIYALAGNLTTTFYRYDPAANTWSARANTPQTVKDGGALEYVPGTARVSKNAAMGASQTVVNSGGRITLTLDLYSNSTVTTVTPGPVTISDTALAGGTAVCGSPTPASLTNVVSGTVGTFAWTCTLTATNRTANITFSAVATASLPSTQAWPRATSHSVIVAPPLTMTLRVLSPTTVSTIDNVAVLQDNTVVGPAPSNLVQTAINNAVGDRVWADLDGDGTQDAGEPNIPGVVVRLVRSNGSVLTATTDFNGAYLFGNLGAGTVTVTYDLATAPAGFIPTTLAQLSYTLTSNQVVTTADFGLQPPGTASIGDTVWLDADNGGTLNPDPAITQYETTLPGVTVRLYVDANNNGVIDGSDHLARSTQTSISGSYVFTGLNAARYLVQVVTSSVVTSTYDASVTSTIAAAMTTTVGTSLTRAYTLTAGQQITTADFGFNWTGSIGNYVWYDTSNDGVQNNLIDEGGTPGATVELYYDTNNNGEPDSGEPILSVVLATTSTGAYLFANLPPGNYVVEAEGQAIPAPASAGALAGSLALMLATTPDEVGVALGAGQVYSQADFGFAPGAIIKGHLFHDVNSSAVRDPAEATGFAGVVVTLTSSGGVVITTSTAVDGSYHFPPIAPGTYTVTYHTTAAVLTNYPALTTPASQTVDVVYGQEQVVDFGRNYAGTIGDTVWIDSNNNGVQDAGEPGIASATVLLYQSGTLLSALATGPIGTYQFTGLAAATYSVTVLTSSVPSNYSLNTTPVLTSVNLGLNQVITTADFGFRSPTTVYTVSGTIVNDLNGDGNLTETQRITDVSVIVVYTPTGQSPITAQVPVDASGNYTVTGIPSGSHVAIEVNAATVPLGYVATTAAVRTVTAIAANQTNQNFGYQLQPATLAGTVVVGINADGVAQTLTETAVSGVTITLRYAGADGFFGTGDDTSFLATTSTSGSYTFTNLLPGNYEVVKQNPAGYSSQADVDGGSPDSIAATLSTSQTLTGRDYELSIDPADILISKADSIDPIMAGSRLTYTLMVTNAGPGIAAGVVVTDVLPTGVSYVTAQPAPAGTSPLTWSMGTLAVNATRTLTVVVDVNVATSGTITNTAFVTSSMPDPTPLNNTALEPTTVNQSLGSLTGTVFVDLDANGVQEVTEAGIPNVSVIITDALGVTQTVTTDASGVYTATGIPAGATSVDVVNSTLPAGYVQTAGTDPTTITALLAVVNDAGKDGYQPQADLSVTKTNNQSLLVPGSLVTYVIDVMNAGPSGVAGARITDTLPAELLSATWSCVAGAGAICSTPGSSSGSLAGVSVTLGAGSHVTFSVVGVIDSGATDTVTNTVDVALPPGYGDPTPGNNSATDVDITEPQADLRIVKDDGVVAATPGRALTYYVSVTNDGPSNVVSATVSDALPAILTNVTWTCTSVSGAICTGSGAGNLSATVSLLKDRSAVFVITGTVPVTASEPLTNTAWVTAPVGMPDPNPGNNISTDIDGMTPEADLGIYKTNGVTVVVPGTPMTYTLVVSNAGPSAVVGAAVVDSLPASYQPTPAWTCSAGSGASCGTSAGSGYGIHLDNVSLMPGSMLTIEVSGVLAVAAPLTISNSAAVMVPGGTIDPVPDNNTSVDDDGVTPNADLHLTKSSTPSNEIVPGTSMSYTIVVSNSGPSLVTDAQLFDSLPAGLTSATWACTGSGLNACAVTSGMGTVSTTITLEPSGAITVEVEGLVNPNAVGLLVNSAAVALPGNTVDPTPEDNSDVVTNTLSPQAYIGISKTDNNVTAIPGTAITYTIVVSNFGPSNAPALVVNDVLPSALLSPTWICEASAGAVCGGNSGTGNMGVLVGLPVAGTITFTVQVTIDLSTTGAVTNAVSLIPQGNLTLTNPLTQSQDTTALTPSIVTGTVFADLNGNAVQDGAEAGLSVVQVVITPSNGVPITLSLDVNGSFSVTVPPGPFTVAVVPASVPAGYALTTANAVQTSNALEGVNATDRIGYQPRGTVYGHLFIDTDGNGAQNGVEPNLSGVSVVITDALSVTRTVTSDASGNYTATVPAGSTTADVVEATLPVGYVQTAGSDPSTVNAVTGGLSNIGSDGYQPQATVYGHLFVDTDGNGAQNGVEPNLSGVSVVITDALSVTRTVTSDASGNYTATVPAGSTTADVVEATLPVGYVQTAGVDPSTVNAPAGSVTSLGDDGYQPRGQVLGVIYTDVDGNGSFSSGVDTPLPGVRVVVTDALGMTLTVTTDSGGNFTATVPSGATIVDVDDATLPPGYVTTTGTTDSTTVTVPSGGSARDDNGYILPARIGDTVWLDMNADGLQSANEPGIAGVVIELGDSSGLVATRTTGANGVYNFTGLRPGTYTVTVQAGTLPVGVTATAERDVTLDGQTGVVLTSGGNIVDADFGFVGAAQIGDLVWNDYNGNSLRDSGEPGLNGVELTLTFSSGFVLTTTTDTNGAYRFDGLTGGIYTVTVNAATLPAASLLTTANLPLQINLGPSEDNATADFGYRQEGLLVGHVFVDTNGNGKQDGGEPNLNNVSVVITDRVGNTQTVTSDASGNYTATVLGGDAVVDIDETTLPPGHVQTAGSDPTTVTMQPGQLSTAGNDGYQPRGVVQGVVYIDRDGDGPYTPGIDTPLAGITVIVTDSLGAPHVLSTDINGTYSSTVPSGLATVDVNDDQLPAGASLTTGSTDPTIVTVPAGGVATDNTGYTLQFVQGVVYNDVNGDGQFQSDIDIGWANVPVTIIDSQGMTYLVTTNASGAFSRSVHAGWAVVDVDQNSIPAGFGLTTNVNGDGNDPTQVLVSPGGSARDNTGYIAATQLEFLKASSVSGAVRPGQLITYQLFVRNIGSSVAINVIVTDSAPLGTLFVAASGGSDIQIDSTVTGAVYRVARLAAGQSVTMTFAVRVSLSPGTVIILNQAQLSSPNLPGVTVASNQVLNPLAPTAVSLDLFSAVMGQGGVLVRWHTSLERDALGYNLLRSNANDRAGATRVNSALIAALGPQGGTYELVDANGIPGSFYWIEEIELSGATRVYGPAQVATLAGGTALSDASMQLGGQVVAAQPGASLAIVGGVAPAHGQSVVPGNASIMQPVNPIPAAQPFAIPQAAAEGHAADGAQAPATAQATQPEEAQAPVLSGQPSASELAALTEAQQRVNAVAAPTSAAVIAGQQRQAGVVRGASEPSQLSVPKRASVTGATAAPAAAGPAVAAVSVLMLCGAVWAIRQRRKRV